MSIKLTGQGYKQGPEALYERPYTSHCDGIPAADHTGKGQCFPNHAA